jgi:hypothetical protein
MTGGHAAGGPVWPNSPTLRERIEAEVREAEGLRVTAEALNRRIWRELEATTESVRHIRWPLGRRGHGHEHETGEGDDRAG